MPQTQTYEYMRKYLWTVLEQGGLKEDPDLAEAVLTALQSPSDEWIPRIFNLVRVQHIELSNEESDESKEPLFRERVKGGVKPDQRGGGKTDHCEGGKG